MTFFKVLIYETMAQLVERANQWQEIIGSLPAQHKFSPENQITEIYTILFRTEKVRENGKWKN